MQSLYRDVLRRPASAGDVSYWARQTSVFGRGRVARAIYSSQEAANARISDLYERLLGRPADEAGLAYFRGVVEHIGTPGAAAQIARTGEYYAHAISRFS